MVFGAHFCSKASHGQCCTYGLKTTLKLLVVVHVLAIMANSYLKIVFSQNRAVHFCRFVFLSIGFVAFIIKPIVVIVMFFIFTLFLVRVDSTELRYEKLSRDF